ncbi:peptidylprolyl isomerase [Lysinibacillus sp. NPDC096418]|uniref:peptidylprolyl isomerase n=1 Tax=Lysinibacillus sp. NPDC096418 TaxID=3364138 RepID=UPI0037F652F4
MKKTVLSLTLAASVLALGACSSAEDKALVTSKVGDISVADFTETAKSLVGPSIIQQMVTEKVLANKYKVTDKDIKAGYDAYVESFGGEDNLKAAILQQGLTVETFKSDFLPLELLQKKALKDQAIKEEDVKKYYEQMKTELNGRHILVEDEATAKEAIEKIKGGASFADVAKEYSSDPGSAEKGGELGWFTVGAMVDEFNDAAYKLELNTLSEPVQSSYGYHVIEITDKRDVKDIGKFEKEEDAIRENMVEKLLKTGESQVLLRDIVAKLAKDANLKTSDKDLKEAIDYLTTTNEEEAAAAEKADKEEAEKADKEDKEEK